MSGKVVRVLAHRQSECSLEQALLDLWQEVLEQRWLEAAAPRVTIQVGQRWRSSLVVETAKSLERLLAERTPSAQIEVLDPQAPAIGSGHLKAQPEASEPAVDVSGIAAPSNVRIPERWFEPFFLVTVTGSGPVASGRISAVLDAQAEPLARLGNRFPASVLAYEAHRLFASDLAIVCGVTDRSRASSEAWWMAASSDVAIEMALAHACGCEPSTMPYIEMIASHEILPAVDLRKVPFRLSGYLAPAWQTRLSNAASGLDMSRRAVVRDVRAVRRNLRRIPGFVRRRLASRKGGSG
jgi:hypothetical protein